MNQMHTTGTCEFVSCVGEVLGFCAAGGRGVLGCGL